MRGCRTHATFPPTNPLVYIYTDEACLGVQFKDRDCPEPAAEFEFDQRRRT